MKLLHDKDHILGLKIDKSLKYKAAAFPGAFMHLTFLVFFFLIKLYTMTIFNVFSVALYIYMGAACKRDSFERRAFAWISVMYLEISIHSFLCTLFLGMDTCYFLYTMMTIPVVLYYLFLTCENRVFRRGTLVFSLCSLALLGGSLVFDRLCKPFFFTFRRPLTVNEMELMRAINIAFNIILLFGFSSLFILEIQNLIRKLNETNERLNYTATHNALTGLYNRHSLNSVLNQLRDDSGQFCLVMGDIDDFKKVNDTYGHECGDEVLKGVAEIIMRGVGENDTACRWGGEEMLMIMHGGAEECLPVISRIRSEINALRIDSDGRTVRVSMTFGFMTSDENSGRDIDAMLSTVDKRLYRGKAGGKNVIIIDDIPQTQEA